MAAHAVRIESVPEGSEREPGTLVACFEAREEAEYFTSIARHLRSLQGVRASGGGVPDAGQAAPEDRRRNLLAGTSL